MTWKSAFSSGSPLRLDQMMVGGVVEGALPVLLLLGAQNVGGAAIADEEVRAVVGVEKFAERFDAADDHQEVVLALKREDRVDQIVPARRSRADGL